MTCRWVIFLNRWLFSINFPCFSSQLHRTKGVQPPFIKMWLELQCLWHANWSHQICHDILTPHITCIFPFHLFKRNACRDNCGVTQEIEMDDIKNYRSNYFLPVFSKRLLKLIRFHYSTLHLISTPYFLQHGLVLENSGLELSRNERQKFILSQFRNKMFMLGGFV